jgi:hypothetical protein
MTPEWEEAIIHLKGMGNRAISVLLDTRLGYMPWDVWMAYNRLRHYSLKEFYSDLLTDPLNKDTHFYKKAVKYLRELGLMEEAEVGG